MRLQINTIEREIEQLSERLDTGRVRRVSSQADLPGEDRSRGGKRLRLRTEVRTSVIFSREECCGQWYANPHPSSKKGYNTINTNSEVQNRS